MKNRGFPMFLALFFGILAVPVSLSAQSQATISVGAFIVSGPGAVDAAKVAAEAVQDSTGDRQIWTRTMGPALVTTRLLPATRLPETSLLTPAPAGRPISNAVVLIEYTAN